MSRGEGGVCSSAGSPPLSTLHVLCCWRSWRDSGQVTAPPQPCASSLSVARGKEAGCLQSILSSQGWQLSYVQGEPVLGKDQGKVCLYPSTWSFSKSTLLVDTFSSVLLAGYIHLCFSPRNPSQALPLSPCNRFFHCFHSNIAPCVLLYQVSEGWPTDGSQTALLSKQRLGWTLHNPWRRVAYKIETLFQRDAKAFRDKTEW